MLSDQGPDARAATSTRLLNSRYELGEKIGEGSFFTVYRGRDLESGRAVAIKLLNHEYTGDREFSERLRVEALRAVKLDHPHIVAVYDAWMEGDRVAVATEYIRGIDLKERVRRVAPFPLAVAIDIAAAVSEALEYAASLDIHHGDLRPENILVTPEGQVKLADFGIGDAVNASSRLQMSALAQTAHYLPPEVAQGKQPSAPSDVYSLGAILFEMLAGQTPFQADTPFAIAVKHLNEPAPALRRFNPGVPKAIEGIVFKCLQKDPAARYPSPEALLADLRGVREALRYGKPLTWTPAPEPNAPAATRADGVARAPEPRPRRKAAAPAPEPATVVERSPGEPSIRLLLILPFMALLLAGLVFGIFVFETRAPRDAVVPSVVGMTTAEAQRRLEAAGLKMKIERETYDDKTPAGTVRFSNPTDGSPVKQGKVVELWISKGPQPSVVPSVVGLSERDARDHIEEARLKVGDLRHENDEVVPAGQVISQTPAADTQVTRDTPVAIVVSKGPETEPPPEPATSPEPAPTPPTDSSGGTDTSGTQSGTTETLTPGAGGTDSGSSTDLNNPSPAGGVAPDAGAPNPTRTFDIVTKIDGNGPQSRLRIIVTDQKGRRQVVNNLYRRGQSVTNTIQAEGPPGTIRIEVYQNGQLVKDQLH